MRGVIGGFGYRSFTVAAREVAGGGDGCGQDGCGGDVCGGDGCGQDARSMVEWRRLAGVAAGDAHADGRRVRVRTILVRLRPWKRDQLHN